jgi:hypothetical protein
VFIEKQSLRSFDQSPIALNTTQQQSNLSMPTKKES